MTNTAPLQRQGPRACETCVKGKVKCIPPEKGQGRCQRCHRLDKTCLPSTSASRKRPQSTQVAQLEQKLDTLVNFLTSKDNAGAATSSSNYPRNPPIKSLQAQGITSTPVISIDSHRDAQPESSPQPSNLPPYFDNMEDPFGSSLSRQDAAFLLLEYRMTMSHRFPFVVIPPDVTPDSLRNEKPMLWKAVMTAASYHKSIQQEVMGWKLMEELSTRLLMKAEKSLDLLQAILVHLCWYHYHSAANPQATNLLFLAKSLLVNLGYHRSRTSKDRSKLNLHLDGSEGLSLDTLNHASTSTSRTLEEWRALAGVYYISAMSASSCRRMDPLLYTPHLDSVCKTLSEIHEYESDLMILPLVLIQNVVSKMSNSLQDLDVSSPLSAIPMRMYMTSLQNELESIKATMPAETKDSATILSCYQVAEISLYEVGLYRAFWQESDKDIRVKTLLSCLMAVKAYFESHFAPGITMPPSLPYFIWVQNGYALLIAAKLCFGKADGWDLGHVRTILDYVGVVDRIVEKLEAIIRLRSPHGQHEIFSRYIKHLRCKQMMKITPTNEFNEEYQPSSSVPGSSEDPSTHPESLTSNSFPSSVDQEPMFMDDNFWQGILDIDSDWMMFGQ